MAGKALAAFFLIVTLLQVQADVDCHASDKCAAGDSRKYVASSARECCLQGLPETWRYSTVNDSSNCTECIVIGFSTNNLTLDEETEQIRTIKVRPLTSASDNVTNSRVKLNIQVYPSGPNATLGSDLKVNDGMEDMIPYDERLSALDDDLKLQTLNDNDTGEIEGFVLKVTNLELTHLETDDSLVAFPGPQLNVTIVDDDIIHVEFEVTEYQLNEEEESLEITFKVSNTIPGPTHFVVRPMRYKDYDDEYENLTTKYPDLKPYSLNDEYDQAELEDFNPAKLYFTIPENLATPDRSVIINVTNDDLVEPAEEGFRLLLEVDESKGTRLSEVTFGRQIALCRIDNTDRIEFGFQKDEIIFIDAEGTVDLQLPLHVISGEVEFPINLTFAIGERTNATVNGDFKDFSTSAKIDLIRPMDFTPQSILEVQVNGDDVFEGDELIEVILEYDLDLPDPFRPTHVNDTSDYGSVVDPPPTGSIRVDRHKTALIIIQEGITNNTAHLSFPNVVQEGDSFYPNITVMHIVNATFRVYASSQEGTARRNIDYSFTAQNVIFDPTSTTKVTDSPVFINTDRLVEPNETFTVEYYASHPPGIQNWMKVINPKVTVTIIDQNSARIGFVTLSEELYEDEGPASFNVSVQGDQLGANAVVVVRVYTTSDTAQSGVDFDTVDKELTFNGTQQKIAVEIPIIDDTLYEQQPEVFQVHLEVISSNVNARVDPALANVTILDNDPPITKDCVLSRSLNLHTFSNELQAGRDVNISMGCERKLVTSCDPNIDLEIRVDFFQDDFDSTKVAIFYDGEKVIMDENFNLIPATSPTDDFVFSTGMMSASVSIPDIMLVITKNRTQLTISTDNTTFDLAGLCGNLDGELEYPDCMDRVSLGESLDEFIRSYKVKPSDQELRGEREACGATTNDTIISDPLMTVPIHAPGFPSDLSLCYEIHGAADKYFNLVSDECTSVNAHYASAAAGSELNIIQSISVVAVDSAGKCHNITVDTSTCNGMAGKRRRRAPTSVIDENGVSVRYYDSRARISVPNCEDNELVMWVVCQSQSLFDQDLNTTIGPVEMIKFEIARGLNLKETSHGLLGQFWNIPISVAQYTGSFVYPVDSREKYYTVEVHYPTMPVRSFVGFMYDVTWEWKHKHCIYAGDRQGGPAGEVANDGSVIEGSYEDYVISDAFGTQFKHGVFREGVCL